MVRVMCVWVVLVWLVFSLEVVVVSVVWFLF